MKTIPFLKSLFKLFLVRILENVRFFRGKPGSTKRSMTYLKCDFKSIHIVILILREILPKKIFHGRMHHSKKKDFSEREPSTTSALNCSTTPEEHPDDF